MSDDEDELIGNYKVLGTLGEGGFGKVRLALHATNGEVAIKTIEKILMPPDEIVTVPEARHMMRLKHPHILKLFEVVDTEEHLHLVMEYAPRGDLCAYLMEAGKLSESAARAWFRQLVSAVQYCHQKNVVHLDIKLQNILVDGQKNIKLPDFGLSERFTPGLRLDKFCGTPEYAAPEIKKQQKYHGPPADVWSLGVVLYSMITGRLRGRNWPQRSTGNLRRRPAQTARLNAITPIAITAWNRGREVTTVKLQNVEFRTTR